MNTATERIRSAAVVLGVVLVLAVCGYRVFGYEWLDAIYMVVITLAGVGYGEKSELEPSQQLFTIIVILFGMSAVAYAIGGIAQLFFEGEIERALGLERMHHEIEQLRNHTIICGYGRIGQILAADLKKHSKPFVIMESDAKRFQQAREHDYLVLQGDATEDAMLIKAGLHYASALISALPNDAANVFITLTARNLNKNVQIISRAEHPNTEKKLRQAGANRIVLPSTIGAQQMVRMITRPSTADLIDLIAQQGNLDLELDEIHIPQNARLVGVTVRDSEAHQEHHLLMLAVKQVNGKMIFHPDPDYVFQTGDIIITLGDAENIQHFRKKYGV
jgi:voltage-gated potassium channel